MKIQLLRVGRPQTLNFESIARRVGLICLLLVSVSLNCQATQHSSIPTKIIPGGEVSIADAQATFDGQKITVSGTGFAIYTHQTCGHAEIALVNANGQVLARRAAEYDTSIWYHESPRKSSNLNRFVSFSANIPGSTSVASVLVWHQSTGGCEHSWSLQHALDWLVEKIFLGKSN
jgi:hypothetical protein